MITISTVFEWVNICDISDGDIRHCEELMPEERRARIERFRLIDDRRRSVIGELLARRLIAGRCGIPFDAIVFGRTERGKPFAVGLPAEFSISHSGEFVLCAVSDSPVGADIEKIRPVRDRLIQRVCSDRELDFVWKKGISDDEMYSRFFQVWTGKEAYLKYLGTGIGVTKLKEFSILDDEICRRMTFFLSEGYAVSIFQ